MQLPRAYRTAGVDTVCGSFRKECRNPLCRRQSPTGFVLLKINRSC